MIDYTKLLKFQALEEVNPGSGPVWLPVKVAIPWMSLIGVQELKKRFNADQDREIPPRVILNTVLGTYIVNVSYDKVVADWEGYKEYSRKQSLLYGRDN